MKVYKDEVFFICFVIIFLVVVVYIKILSEKYANKECRVMLALARTHSDTLTVYTMKPNSNFTTCAERLR
jgi:hypothetical protein